MRARQNGLREIGVAKYEFKFVITDVELSKEVQARVGQAVAQAGALALAEITPPEAITVGIGRNIWWRGIPVPDLVQAIQEAAVQKAKGR